MLSDDQLRRAYDNGFCEIARPESAMAESHADGLRAVEAAVRADMQREVRTVEELDALPVGSVLQIMGGEDHPIAAMKNTTYNWPGPDGAAWWVTGFSDDDGYSAHRLLDLYDEAQMTVLFTPSTPNQQGAEQK